MTYANYYAITFSIIGFFLSLQGLWLVSTALWPARVQRAAARAEHNPVACFFLGIPVTAIAVLIAIALGRRFGGPGQVMAFLIAFALVLLANLGLAGFTTSLGGRLGSPVDTERPWYRIIRGGAALELSWLIPVVGWVGLLPVSILLGVGAGLLSFFGSARQSSASTPSGVHEANGTHAAVSRPPVPRPPAPLPQVFIDRPALPPQLPPQPLNVPQAPARVASPLQSTADNHRPALEIAGAE